jgi:hypothetical protein
MTIQTAPPPVRRGGLRERLGLPTPSRPVEAPARPVDEPITSVWLARAKAGIQRPMGVAGER